VTRKKKKRMKERVVIEVVIEVPNVIFVFLPTCLYMCMCVMEILESPTLCFLLLSSSIILFVVLFFLL